MPGAIAELTEAGAVGWARHAARPGYPVTVSAILDAHVVASAIADQLHPAALPDAIVAEEAAGAVWFAITFTPPEMLAEDLAALRFVIGETDEALVVPGPRRPASARAAGGRRTLEDILAVNVPRPWVTGATHQDAEAAGLADEDIVDLLYRDILGRHADPAGLLNYIQRLKTVNRSFDHVRHSLLESDEYRRRRIDAADAPGAIFSQRVVLYSGRGSGSVLPRPDAASRRIRLRPMLGLAAEAFISRLYLEVIQKPIDATTLQAYVDRVASGLTPFEIAAEMQGEARSLGIDEVTILELDDHQVAPEQRSDAP